MEINLEEKTEYKNTKLIFNVFLNKSISKIYLCS